MFKFFAVLALALNLVFGASASTASAGDFVAFEAHIGWFSGIKQAKCGPGKNSWCISTSAEARARACPNGLDEVMTKSGQTCGSATIKFLQCGGRIPRLPTRYRQQGTTLFVPVCVTNAEQVRALGGK